MDGELPDQISEAQESSFDVIEQFRRGDVNKTTTIFQVTQFLSGVDDINENNLESALSSF
jgi:hypothetical protein